MVKNCPKCGFKNRDKAFWCKKCKHRFIENFDLTSNEKIRQDPEFNKEYEEYKDEENLYHHPKSKKKILAAVMILLILSVIIIGYFVYNIKNTDPVKSKDEDLLIGTWEISKYLSNNKIQVFESNFTITFKNNGQFESYDSLTGFKNDKWWTEGNKIFFITKTIDTSSSWNSFRLYTPVGWTFSFTDNDNLELKMVLGDYNFKYFLIRKN